MLIRSDLNCNIGCVRQNNEDIILLGGELFRDKTQTLNFEIEANTRFSAIVADGMGGHKGGEIASEYAAEFFNDFVVGLDKNLSAEEVTEKIKEWAQTAHKNILRQGIENSEYDGMGTTFCGILFYEHLVFSLNIGDSRLYRFRNDILRQLSADHSMRELTGDKTIASNQIYNSLGAGDKTFVDVKDITGQLFDNDIFVICSDGLCDMITDEEIERMLRINSTADNLVEAARSAGGKDNVSVILLEIKETESKIEAEQDEEIETLEEKSVCAATENEEIPGVGKFPRGGNAENAPQPNSDRN